VAHDVLEFKRVVVETPANIVVVAASSEGMEGLPALSGSRREE